MKKRQKVAICGAGIAGVSTAYYLLKKNKNFDVILIDKNQPLSFTTSKSGENYRNYWPQKCMQALAKHSIELMYELQKEYGLDAFDMINSGYNFVSHNKEKSIFNITDIEAFDNEILETTDSNIIQKEYSYLDKEIKKIVTIKNAGRIDVNAMGTLLIREINKRGGVFYDSEIVDISEVKKQYQIALNSGENLLVDKVVIAAGPFINQIANMLGVNFAISNSIQSKFIIPDPKKVIPKNMPFTIYADPQYLDWSEAEKAFFTSEKGYNWLLNRFPGGIHIRPDTEGIKMGWAFQVKDEKPNWDAIKSIDFFPNIVLKGASRFIPKLIEYENNIPSPLIQYSGYYTRTKENWPLIGPTKAHNVFVIGALSGFGTMIACGAGELCASYILNETNLPQYHTHFNPNRYTNASVMREIEMIDSDGQL
ncbi:NAD(P)/FAD-dependent oxidoreductase [Aquimarina sediminis]|uniref:NAD(P)/FAD-dependent oxidoreductase n=1 Tax=Aquimarina sediminis TaxID=2070536 RepID=UPI000CA02AE3|nr:FAD-dependent oxidoreductase [Aquimarina sediminis]